MEETVTNTNERKSLFSLFLKHLEVRVKQNQAEREHQDEKFQRISQKSYHFHARQQRDVAEIRRCVAYISQHAHALETVLRSAAGTGVPLSAALAHQASVLQRCMEQGITNAARIRQLLAAAQQPQMDSILAKMEAELKTWTAIMQRTEDATCTTEAMCDKLQNLIEVQKRCVQELSSSSVFTSLCDASAGAGEKVIAGPEAAANQTLFGNSFNFICSSPLPRV